MAGRDRLAAALGAIATACFAAAPGAAQTLTIMNDLDFGQLVASDDNPGFLTIAPNGAVTTSANVVRVVDGGPAEFLVEGLAPGQGVTVAFGGPERLSGPSQAVNRLTWSTPVIAPATPTADAFGRLTFRMGATLHTTSDTPSGMNETNFQNITVTVTPIL